MIRIKPYYERPDSEEILAFYLNLVADATPFPPEDVLDDIKMEPNSLSRIPRKRTKAYKELLDSAGIPCGTNQKEKRISDALLAQKLIRDYSETLYDKLYGDPTMKDTPGAVNRPFLRKLLTARFLHGSVPEELVFSDRRTGEAAEMLREYVFRYDAFSKQGDRPRGVFQLLAMLNVEVCPYCNRQYITTVADGPQRVRPQLDHFRNKKDYPYLALSINNLIPSCGVCNLLKHDDDKKILYPYDEGMGNSYCFQARCGKDNITSLLQGAGDAVRKFELKMEKNADFHDGDLAGHARESIDTLALEQLYQSHRGYVADLFFQRYVFTDALLEEIKRQFPALFAQDEDLMHLLRLMDYSPEAWERRPLAKLTHDIVKQMDSLYEKSPE